MYQLNQIPSEAQIGKHLRRILFGKNIFCPNCRSRKVVSEHRRYHCRSCRSRFSLLSHTWLANMKMPLQKFWLILWCWTSRVPMLQATALSKISEKGLRHWYNQFRAHLPQEYPLLERIVQLDEAYGKRWALLLAKQKGTRKLAYEFLDRNSVQRQHAFQFLQDYIKPRSRLYTDGAAIYRGIEKWWPVKHRKDIHRKFEFTHTSEIEGMFGVFRTFIRRMYHHVTPEKMPEVVREFCLRFSSSEIFENPRIYLQKTLSLVTTG